MLRVIAHHHLATCVADAYNRWRTFHAASRAKHAKHAAAAAHYLATLQRSVFVAWRQCAQHTAAVLSCESPVAAALAERFLARNILRMAFTAWHQHWAMVARPKAAAARRASRWFQRGVMSKAMSRWRDWADWHKAKRVFVGRIVNRCDIRNCCVCPLIACCCSWTASLGVLRMLPALWYTSVTLHT